MGNNALELESGTKKDDFLAEKSTKRTYSKIKVKHPFEEIFQCDAYSIEQPFFQIMQEGYSIFNNSGSESYNAARKRQWFRQIFSRMVGSAAFVGTVVGGVMLSSQYLPKESPLIGVAVLVAMGIGVVAYIAVSKFVAPIRKTSLYKGDTDQHLLFTIEPTSGMFIFNREYHLKDQNGEQIVVFKRPFIESIFRIRWHAYTPKGEYIYTAVEDSLVMALLRRYLRLGRLIPLHFHLNKGGGKKFGEFKRKFSLRDKYQLSHDPKAIPSWMVIATAILLDTGEER